MKSARYLLCWEFGGGLGHVSQLNPLATVLRKAGHHVAVAYPRVDSSFRPDQKTPFYRTPRVPDRAGETQSFYDLASVLCGLGLDDSRRVTGLVSAWQTLFDLERPDVLIFDYAPLAMLASRGRAHRRIAFEAVGFSLPPTDGQSAATVRGAPAAAKRLAQHADRRLMQAWNAAPRLAKRPLSALAELYAELDARIGRWVPELDHYDRTDDVALLGLPQLTDLPDPVHESWADGDQARILVYIKPFPGLDALLGALAQQPAQVLVYAAEGSADTALRYTSDQVRVFDRPLALADLLPGADLVVCHGGLNLVQQGLASATPLLLIPQHAEQAMNSQNVVRLKAGQMLSLNERSLEIYAQALSGLLSDQAAATAAAEFARRYANRFDGADLADRLPLFAAG